MTLPFDVVSPTGGLFNSDARTSCAKTVEKGIGLGVSRARVDRHDRPALLELGVVVLGFMLRDSRTDQRSDESRDPRTGGRVRQDDSQGARGDRRTNYGDHP